MAMTLRGERMDGSAINSTLPAGQPKPGSIAERLFKQHQRVQADANRRLAHRAELQKNDLNYRGGKEASGLGFFFGYSGRKYQSPPRSGEIRARNCSQAFEDCHARG